MSAARPAKAADQFCSQPVSKTCHLSECSPKRKSHRAVSHANHLPDYVADYTALLANDPPCRHIFVMLQLMLHAIFYQGMLPYFCFHAPWASRKALKNLSRSSAVLRFTYHCPPTLKSTR